MEVMLNTIFDVSNGEEAYIFAQNPENFEIISLLFLGWTESLEDGLPSGVDHDRLVGFLKGLSGWALEDVETNMYSMMYFYTVSTQDKNINDYLKKDKLDANLLSDFSWDTLRESCKKTFNCKLCTRENSPYCTFTNNKNN